jgi:hypothetical protein
LVGRKILLMERFNGHEDTTEKILDSMAKDTHQYEHAVLKFPTENLQELTSLNCIPSIVLQL